MSSSISKPINTLELRVLHGPQAGAILPISNEGLIIGNSLECDVILQSPSVAARHACLSITEDDFSLYVLNGEVIASLGAPTTPPWQFGTTIYLGDIGITIDRSDAEWLATTPPKTITDTPSEIKSILLWQTRLLRYWKHIVLSAVVLVTLSIAIQLILPSHNARISEQRLSAKNLDAINTLLLQHGRSSHLTLDTTEKKAVVHGFLPSVKQVHALRRDLAPWHQNLTVDVQAEDALLSAGQHFLIQEHSPLKISIIDGHAQLSGLDTRQEDIKRLAKRLKENVTELAGVNTIFVDRSRLEAWLHSWNKDISAQDRENETLHIVVATDGNLELRGTLSSPRIEQLRDSLRRHTQQKNMLLALRIVTSPPSASGNRPPVVRAFSAGSVPYVFLVNGKRLMIGGTVNGFQLIAINEKGPIFEKQGA